CDSKHPRCTACVTAGVACNQEDRHRQTTIARDHTERLEQIVSQCDALLKRHIQGFSLQSINDVCAREGIDISALQPIQNLPPPTSSPQPAPMMTPAPPPPPGYYPPPPPPAGVGYYQYPPYTLYPVQPPFHVSSLPVPSAQPAVTIPGQDPKSNDMSSTHALAKSFGVAPYIVNDASTSPAPLYQYPPPPEDLAVGSSGLDSGRDRVVQLEPAPRDTAKWRVVSVFRSSHYSSAASMDIWIPNDRKTLRGIVDVYFDRLNPHRPVFFRNQFIESLNQLYDEGSPRPVFDPGFICSLYLVLALGTLSELNRSGYQGEVSNSDNVGEHGSDDGIPHLPPDWPAHDEFFYRALAIKSELRVTLSSLQALILLHWYLYAERQGRTLWRLVGSIVRLAIELGLHHDPTTQTMPRPKNLPQSPTTTENDEAAYEDVSTFSAQECALRIRLWSIVLVHDRGTSILLGRPLAIAPSDSNTPRPSNTSHHAMNDQITEHFVLSAPIAEIQADIIISLYSPTRQSGESLLRNATRIIKSINLFRRSLPAAYQHYFTGTGTWSTSARHALLANLDESTGLTLLKIAISRILLLRALFSSKELGYAERKKALVDAIIQAHNVIAIHTVLVRYPEVGFFTSPIPLHIAAMVILYGRVSKCDEGIPGLSDGDGSDREEGRHSAVRILMEDVWLALDMLPRFRWRWETGPGSSGGTNPLIAKLAEEVMDRMIAGIGRQGPVGQPLLIPEPEWMEEATSPRDKNTSNTPVSSSATWGESSWAENAGIAPSGAPTGPPSTTSTRSSGMQQSNLPTIEVLQSLFYPFYADGVPVHPDDAPPSSAGGSHAPNGSSPPQPPRLSRSITSGSSVPVSSSNGSTNSLLAAVAVQARAHGGQQGAPDMYMNEERGIQQLSPPVGGTYVSLNPPPGAYHPGTCHSIQPSLFCLAQFLQVDRHHLLNSTRHS
ncbi:fungal-specific transcription factor domain-containing protein, partial [Lentinula raphanica]